MSATHFKAVTPAVLSRAIRKALRHLGVSAAVKSKSRGIIISPHPTAAVFPMATITVTRPLTYIELSCLADALRRLEKDPLGGRGYVQVVAGGFCLPIMVYAWNYPSRSDFWKQVERDLENCMAGPVVEEAWRQAREAYAGAGQERKRPQRVWCLSWICAGALEPAVRALSWPQPRLPDLRLRPVRRCPIALRRTVDGLMPSIVRDGKKVTRVKRLGWLIAHRKLVEEMDAYPHPPVTRGMWPEVYLVARLSDGRTYETGYFSLSVMRDWLGRSRTLRGIRVNYHKVPAGTQPSP